MGQSLDDATEETDPDDDQFGEHIVAQDPWWQAVIYDENGDLDWYQVPRFNHWGDWRLWFRARRPGTDYWTPTIHIWIEGTNPPAQWHLQLRRHPLSHGLLVLNSVHILPSPWSGPNCLTGKPVVSVSVIMMTCKALAHTQAFL